MREMTYEGTYKITYEVIYEAHMGSDPVPAEAFEHWWTNADDAQWTPEASLIASMSDALRATKVKV